MRSIGDKSSRTVGGLELTAAEADGAARFLDAHTLVNRWMVALFRHFSQFPPEAVPYWSFWTLSRGRSRRGRSRAGILAHSFHTATTYAVLDAAADIEYPRVERLLRGELRPEKLVGDGPPLELWEKASPDFFARARGREETVVLALSPGQLASGLVPSAGFRPALPDDAGILRQLERQYAREMGEEDPDSDLLSLIARRMVFVFEVEGEVAGTIRSNLSDGRYVHVGGVYVAPRFRGRGIGGRLVAGLSASIHAAGDSVILDTARSNEAALSVYRATGFREVGSGLVFRFAEDAWRERG